MDRREKKQDGDERISVEGIVREIDVVLERIEAFDPGKDAQRRAEKEQSRRILEGVRETLLGAFADEYMAFHYWHFWSRPRR